MVEDKASGTDTSFSSVPLGSEGEHRNSVSMLTSCEYGSSYPFLELLLIRKFLSSPIVFLVFVTVCMLLSSLIADNEPCSTSIVWPDESGEFQSYHVSELSITVY